MAYDIIKQIGPKYRQRWEGVAKERFKKYTAPFEAAYARIVPELQELITENTRLIGAPILSYSPAQTYCGYITTPFNTSWSIEVRTPSQLSCPLKILLPEEAEFLAQAVNVQNWAETVGATPKNFHTLFPSWPRERGKSRKKLSVTKSKVPDFVKDFVAICLINDYI